LKMTETSWKIAMITHRPDDGGSTDLWNVSKFTPVYTALQPRRQPSLTEASVTLGVKKKWQRLITGLQHLWDEDTAFTKPGGLFKSTVTEQEGRWLFCPPSKCM
jgi:hypothetical protein